MRSQPAVLGPGQQPGNKVTPPAQVETVSFDVAEAASRFIFDEESVDEDRLPDYGNSFVTQGYIYPEGTLEENNGVKANGEPDLPDKGFVAKKQSDAEKAQR